MVSDQSIFGTSASRLAHEGHPFAGDLPPAEQRSPTQSGARLCCMQLGCTQLACG